MNNAGTQVNDHSSIQGMSHINPWANMFNQNMQPLNSIPANRGTKLSALTRILQQQHTPYAEPTQVSKGLTEIAQGGTLVAFNTIENINVTVIDEQGVVSTNVFPSDQVTSAGENDTAGTTPALVPGATLNPFVLQRNVNVLINVFAFGRNDNFLIDGSTMELSVVDSISGTLLSYTLPTVAYLTGISQNAGGTITGLSYDSTSLVSDGMIMTTLAAGTHSLSLYYNVNGSGTAKLLDYQLSYVVLGQ